MSAAHFHRDLKKTLARFKGRTVRLSFFPDSGTTWVAEILPEHHAETLEECANRPIARGTGTTQAEAIDNLRTVEWKPR